MHKIFKIINNLRSRKRQKKIINVERIKKSNDHRIGIDDKDYINFLIVCKNNTNTKIATFDGDYLNIEYDEPVTIQEKQTIKKEKCVVIVLMTHDSDIEKLFIYFIDILLKNLPKNPDVTVVEELLEEFSKFFTKKIKHNISEKVEIGLWGELCLISSSKNIPFLVDCWHKNKSDIFDFNDGSVVLEVKTTKSLKHRKHFFKYEQLKSQKSKNVFVCSIVTEEIIKGKKIDDLVKMIDVKLTNNQKLNFYKTISDTLNGASFMNCNLTLDYTSAINHIKLYNTNIIPTISQPPSLIDKIVFRVDLKNLKTYPYKRRKKGILSFIN